MAGQRKDFFGLRYPDNKPIYFDRFGIELQVAGMVVTGKDKKLIFIFLPEVASKNLDLLKADMVNPSIEEWADVLKFSDDPQYYETSPDGFIVKAIHRKCQRQIGQELQWKIYRKQGFKCFYCRSERPLTMDHKTPVELGGTDEESNLVGACHSCNREKANMPWEEWVKVCERRGWNHD